MIGKIIGILFIISVIGSIMEKIEKSKKKSEIKNSNNNRNSYIKSQANINTVYNKKFKENDIIMFAVAMQDTLESMTGKMLTKQEISGLAQNYRFAYENFNEDDVYWGNYGASYKINGKDLYHPLFRKWESNFIDEDKKMMYQLKDFNRKFSDFLGENYDNIKDGNTFYNDFKYNYDSNYDETPESIFAKANDLYPKYIKYFYTDQEYYSKVEEYINLYEFQKNSTYILGKDLDEFLEEYIVNK